MISIVISVWRQDVYRRIALPWISAQVEQFGAELIEIRGRDSIFASLEAGRQKATHDVVMYVHDDARLVEPMDFAPQAVEAFEERPNLGLIGPYGKGNEPKAVPWWDSPGPWFGHYMNRRNGKPVYRYARANGKMRMSHLQFGGWDKWQRVAVVDGFCLIEHRGRMTVPWDTETFPGHWHGYDVDRCMQAHKLGLDVMVSPWLFMHDNAGHEGYRGTESRGEGDALWIQDLGEVNGLLHKKWGLRHVGR